MLLVIVKRNERTDSRASMVRSAAALLRTRGVNATSFSEVLADSGAPRASIYYPFPKGRRRPTQDALRRTADAVLAPQPPGRPPPPPAVWAARLDQGRPP